MSYANVAYDLLPYNMAWATLSTVSNSKKRYWHLMYNQVLQARYLKDKNYFMNLCKSYVIRSLYTTWKWLTFVHITFKTRTNVPKCAVFI